MVSNAENVSIWWRHHVLMMPISLDLDEFQSSERLGVSNNHKQLVQHTVEVNNKQKISSALLTLCVEISSVISEFPSRRASYAETEKVFYIMTSFMTNIQNGWRDRAISFQSWLTMTWWRQEARAVQVLIIFYEKLKTIVTNHNT